MNGGITTEVDISRLALNAPQQEKATGDYCLDPLPSPFLYSFNLGSCVLNITGYMEQVIMVKMLGRAA